MRRKSSLLVAAIVLLISACAQSETTAIPTISPSPPTPTAIPAVINGANTPDLEATVVSAVQATVSAALTATAVAVPAPTATATATPEPTATATAESGPTATAMPTPTVTVEPTPTATATAEPEPAATATAEPEPIATIEALPTPQIEAQNQVSIQNVDLTGEVVVIVNAGASPQIMTGWELLSEEGGQRFVFPQFTLDPGAAVRVTSGPNGRQDPPGVLQWLKSDESPYLGHIWNNDGDVAILSDSGGNEVSRFP